ncbi:MULTISPECIES: hypothetical protein [Allobacillus]|uniref:Uncharacterized protein n=1 Tax=Allobacillus halotolerans TaxID=570278 RepID=A0ABS6GR95_9BACI|nr:MULTISPECIES: hypothetical protein [Allobacillus]MBU6081631.1 hypothetical protein [Allobacillus halotolerans]TSJ66337.1 hypothetical protein FPQ10_07730 [Allobacillus sp. SKP2-8]
MIYFYIGFAVFIFYSFNSLTHKFCTKSEMSAEKSSKVYRTINVSMLILLFSSYYEVFHLY